MGTERSVPNADEAENFGHVSGGVRGLAPGQLYHTKGRGDGFVLTYGGKRFYFSGDTENVPEVLALKNIDVAFMCMNLPYTMPPDEAAETVKAFHPKIVYPYHYKGSDLSVFQKDLQGTGIDVRLLDWYPSGNERLVTFQRVFGIQRIAIERFAEALGCTSPETNAYKACRNRLAPPRIWL